jgi:septum formation inhibitor-activating ATPase MinD
VAEPAGFDFDQIRFGTDRALGKSDGLAPVLISWAGKGGVGKTSTSITIAQGAGRAGLKTTLIDSSIGQNGVSVVLRVNKRSTPTIYDAATSGDLKRAFLTPAMLSDIRTGGAVEDMTFALVAAPPSGLADPHVVTGDVYSRIIQLARETSDLVVIDTQIREAALAAQHTIFTQAIVPLLKADGWGVGLTDNSVEGFNHLLGRFAEFQAMGIGRERMLSVINRFDPNQVDPAQMKKQFRAYSEYLGIIEEDPHALAAFNSGRTALHLPGFHLMVNAILSRVIGDEQRFPYTNDIDSLMDGRAGGYDAAPRKKRRGLFALFGRK